MLKALVKRGLFFSIEKGVFTPYNGDVGLWGEFHPLGINLPPKHVFGCRERPANPYRVSWRSVQGTKKRKDKKHAWGEHFTPTPKRPPFTYTFGFVHVGWGHRRNHPCQVSSQSVQQFRLQGVEIHHFS